MTIIKPSVQNDDHLSWRRDGAPEHENKRYAGRYDRLRHPPEETEWAHYQPCNEYRELLDRCARYDFYFDRFLRWYKHDWPKDFIKELARDEAGLSLYDLAFMGYSDALAALPTGTAYTWEQWHIRHRKRAA